MTWSLEHDMVMRRFATAGTVWIHGLGEQSASFDAIAARLPGFTHVPICRATAARRRLESSIRRDSRPGSANAAARGALMGGVLGSFGRYQSPA
jgi:hypothetical protein